MIMPMKVLVLLLAGVTANNIRGSNDQEERNLAFRTTFRTNTNRSGGSRTPWRLIGGWRSGGGARGRDNYYSDPDPVVHLVMDDRKSDALDCMYHITDVLWMDYGLKVSPTTEKDLYKNFRRGDIISDVIWKKIDEDECNLILEGIEDDLPDDIKNRRRYGGTPFNKSKKGRSSRTTSYFFDEKIFKEQDKCYKDCDNTYGKKATIPDKEELKSCEDECDHKCEDDCKKDVKGNKYLQSICKDEC